VTTAGLAARCLAELGPIDGAIAVDGTGRLARALAARGAAPGPVVAGACVFLGDAADGATRGARLRELARRLPPGAPLLAVDHNQPRVWWRRGIGRVLLGLRGLPPSRARRSLAQDVVAAGFGLERLRLAAGERIQLVLARRLPGPPGA
jgi:hypothetical protein